MTGKRALPAIVALTMMLLAGACGDDGDDSAGSDDDGSSEPTSTTTTTHPSTEDDEEAAFDIIRDLEAELDGIQQTAYSDPSVVDDPDNRDLRRVEEILTDGNPGVDGLRDSLEGLNGEGVAQVAASPGVYRETYVYQLASEDADTIRYAYCTVQDMVRVDSEGNELDGGSARGKTGIRVAHRQDGIWRIGMDEDSNTEDLEPGSAYPGYCEDEIVVDDDLEGGEQ